MRDTDFTDDDIGKDVLDEDGNKIGIVSSVKTGTAYVDPDPGVTDKIKAALEWDDTGEDTYPLQEASVEMVTDDVVRLRSNL